MPDTQTPLKDAAMYNIPDTVRIGQVAETVSQTAITRHTTTSNSALDPASMEAGSEDRQGGVGAARLGGESQVMKA